MGGCMWCPQASPESRGDFCGGDTVAIAMRSAMKKWPHLLLIAEIPCDFVCDSKIASECGKETQRNGERWRKRRETKRN